MFATFAAVAIAAATCISSVEGHGFLAVPTPRARTIAGHRWQYEPQSDGTFNGECMDGGKVGPIQATWNQGQVITVSHQMTQHHSGEYQLRFCADPFGGNSCLSKTLAIPITNPSNKFLPNSMSAAANGQFAVQWQLPAGLVCEHCVMQFWYQNNNGVPEHFKSCHDVRIVGVDGQVPPPATSSAASSTTPSSTPTPPAPTGSECPCRAISASVTDAWCSPPNGVTNCVPDFAEYCQRKCDGAPATTTTTATSSSSAPPSGSIPVVTLTQTVTVTAPC